MTGQACGLDADSLRPAVARVDAIGGEIVAKAAFASHFPVSLVPDPVRSSTLSVDTCWPGRWEDNAGATDPGTLLSRIPLAYAWELLLHRRNDALPLSGRAAARTRPTDAVGAAFRECLTGDRSSRPKLAAHIVPNRLGEDEREHLLRALRLHPVAERVELVWRPIAAVLEWIERFGSSVSGGWEAGQSIGYVIHLHLGLEAFEATSIAIVPHPHQGRLLLLPGRRPPNARDLLVGAPLAFAEALCERIGQKSAPVQRRQYSWELLWKSPLLLAATDKPGPTPPAPPWFAGAPVNGALAQFPRSLEDDPSATAARMLATLGHPPSNIRWWIDQLSKPDGSILGAVITGPLAHPESSAGKALSPLIRRVTSAATQRVLVEGRDAHFLLATGACRYAARKLAGMPTYLDTLPVVSTIARDEIGEPFWINLLETRTPWVLGGNVLRFTPEKTRFQLARGESNLTLTVHRDGVDTCRQVASDLGQPLATDCPVHLSIEVEPAQGRPRVDVVPQDRSLFRGQTVILDWDTASDTKRTREQELEAVERCFPPPEPRLASSNRWLERQFHAPHAGIIGVRGLVNDYCANPGAWQHDGTRSLQVLNNCLKEAPRLRPGGTVSTCVSSDHRLHDLAAPDDIHLLATFVTDVDKRLGSTDAAERRDCIRILGSVSARSPRLLGIARDFLRGRQAAKSYLDENALLWAIGNCLSEQDDVQLFFRHVDREPMTADRAQALARVLMYRPMVLNGATSAQCETWLKKSMPLLSGPLRGTNLELSRGALAIAYILRRRLFASEFLPPHSALASSIKARVTAMLAREASATTPGAKRTIKSLRQFLQYIDLKGRGRLTALAVEGETDDSADVED